jgi:hypothetical protein
MYRCLIKKSIWFPLMFSITVFLSAQTSTEATLDATVLSKYANVKVWVAPTVGGTAEDRAYFDFNLPEEIKGSGYELTNTLYPTIDEARQASDFYITAALEYDEEYGDNVLIAELYNTETGALIITTSMGYRTTDEMNDWNLTMIYRLMANAPISKGLSMEESEFTGSEEASKKEYPEYRLFLGIRGGYSLRFYTPHLTRLDRYSLGENTFEGAFHISYHPWRYLGFQSDLVFALDNVTFQNYDPRSNLYLEKDTYRSMSLMIPLMVKGIFRVHRFVISPLAGVYLLVPFSMKANNERTAFSTKPPLGITVGVDIGMHLGPGLLFLDIRYSGDLGDTVSDGTPVYKRNMVGFSVGYKFGLRKKEPPIETADTTE